jgi:hypothetical protein
VVAAMPNCPICGYKYNSEHDSNRSKCDWSISDDPTVFPLPGKVINWAKESWYKYELEQQKQINRQLQEKLDKFRQESSEKFNIIQQSLEKLSQQIINLNQKSETSDRENFYSGYHYTASGDRDPNNNYYSSERLQISEVNSEHNLFTESDRVDRDKSRIESASTEQTYADQIEQYVVENYNKAPSSFSINTIDVSTTNESIEASRNGDTNNISFEITPRGNYWIYSWKGFHYLIPKDKPKINPFQLEICQIIFDCENYQENYSGLQLIKPVKVSPLSGEQWQLHERGIIRFL